MSNARLTSPTPDQPQNATPGHTGLMPQRPDRGGRRYRGSGRLALTGGTPLV